MVKKFTFFLEYKGGTYISQVTAESFVAAPSAWANQFDLHTKPELREYFTPSFRADLIKSLDLNMISPMDGLENTWSFSAYQLSEPATIHFTQTESA
jgi:hypothetical protein